MEYLVNDSHDNRCDKGEGKRKRCSSLRKIKKKGEGMKLGSRPDCERENEGDGGIENFCYCF